MTVSKFHFPCRRRREEAVLAEISKLFASLPRRLRFLKPPLVIEVALLLFSLLAWLPAMAQTNQSPADIRAACINGRRCVCGKVIKIVPEGLVVESGYTALMHPPFTGSWVIPSGALVSRDSKLIERDEPTSPCIGTVLLTDFPKRPAVKLYDYVLLQAYPAGEYLYTPVPGVEKQIRKFAGGLDTAVKTKVAAEK